MLEIERESFPNPHWDARSFLRFECVVAEVDHHVAGFLVSREISPPGPDAPAEREILNLAVAPIFRRKGIAMLLLTHELSFEADHFLEVRESKAAGRALYRKIGFVEIGERQNYYDNPVERAIVMRMK